MSGMVSRLLPWVQSWALMWHGTLSAACSRPCAWADLQVALSVAKAATCSTAVTGLAFADTCCKIAIPGVPGSRFKPVMAAYQ